MVAQDPGAQGHGIAGGDGGVRPDLQRQLVEVVQGADAGVLHRVVHLVHGGIDGVDGDHADDTGTLGLVPVSGHIAAAIVQGDLHAQGGPHIQGGQVQLGIQNLHIGIGLDVAGRHLTGAGGLDIDGLDALEAVLDALAVELGQQALHVQNDLGHVLFHAGNGGKLVLHTGDLDAGGRRAGQRGEHDAPQRIAQGRSEAALQRFDHIFSVGSIAGCFNALNLGLLDFDHAVPSFILITVRTSPHLLGSFAL